MALARSFGANARGRRVLNHWNPWSITISILLLCALLGWIIRLARERPVGVNSDWKRMGKILLTIICGAVMAAGGCFGFLSQMNKANHRQEIFIGLGLSGLAIFAAGLLWWIISGVWYLIFALRRRSTVEEVKSNG